MYTISFINELYLGDVNSKRTEKQYEDIFEDLQRFGVEPQIYHMINTQKLNHQFPDWFVKKLKQQVDLVAFQNMFIKAEQRGFFEQFEQNQIEVIPLKGICFTETYFNHISARATNDIDLLVHSKDKKKAIELFRSLGYEAEEGPDDPTHFHILFNKTFENKLFSFIGAELHWNVLRNNVSQTLMEDFWKESQSITPYKYVKELSLQQTFYHICLHGMNHQMMSLKYIIDILHLIHSHSDHLNYEQLFIQAKRDKNETKLLMALSLIYELFPYLHQLKPLNRWKKYPLWDLDIARKLAWGQKGMEYYAFRARSTFAVHDTWHHQIAFLRTIVFPPLASISTDWCEKPSTFRTYMKLYVRRIRSMVLHK